MPSPRSSNVPQADPFSLAGRRALVTGGTQGVGAAIAIALAGAGADVCLHGLEPNAFAEQTIKACQQAGVAVATVYADLADEQASQLERFVAAVDEQMPGIDLLVNNAGIFIDSSFLEMTRERYRRTFMLNCESGFFLTQHYAKQWISRGVNGRVLFTGSINGLLAEPGHVAYDASKGAVAAMVRSLCVALAPHGIRVNSLAPGLVRTPLTNAVLDHDPQSLQWMRLHTPSGQVPGPEVCGGAAVFLLSDAASHVHGQTLYVDGGMSIWQQPIYPRNGKIAEAEMNEANRFRVPILRNAIEYVALVAWWLLWAYVLPPERWSPWFFSVIVIAGCWFKTIFFGTET